MEVRNVVRVALCDGAGRVLLFSVAAADGRFAWALPGGAVEPDESDADAALREMEEELGLPETPRVGRLFASWVQEFPHERRTLWQSRAYIAKLDTPFAVPEIARWWSRTDLQSAQEQFLPPNLPQMLLGLPEIAALE